MKNQNNVLIVALAALAFAFAPVVQAAPSPDGGPTQLAANDCISAANDANSAYSPDPESGENAVVAIHSTDNVTRGKIGSFVLNMSPALMLGGMYVNFCVGGTAVPGVDYVALVSPAHIAQSGYGVIKIQTLPDRRSSSSRQAYSVVITLKDGAGYSVGKPSSATMWIKP
jgi:hypothetical protein